MKYEEIARHNGFHKWFDYIPHDAQYMKYAENNPSAVAAGFMIGEVYHAFSYARASLMFSLENNYGDLAKQTDDLAMLTVRYIFVQNMIMQYAICEDLSWQVIWAYILPADIQYLMKNEYEKMTKECNRDNLLAQLNCGIGQHNLTAEKLKNILTSFDNDEEVMKFRTLNNYLKHRGNIHIQGLGNDDNSLMFAIDGCPVSIRAHESYKLEELQDMAWAYHKKFEKYFNEIIDTIMPSDYLDTTISFVDGVNAVIKMCKAQNDN